MTTIRSADLGRSETLTIEPRGTAGTVRLVRIQINDPIVGAVGINVDLGELKAGVAGFDNVGRRAAPIDAPPPPDCDRECCASGRCELCAPWVWR